jgi:hypothetical protein
VSVSVSQYRRAAFDCFKRIPVDRPVRLLGVRLSNLERR